MPTWSFSSLSPVIKVVSAGCNLRCKYCFYAGSQPVIRVMKEETLVKLLEACMGAARFVRFIWHGGEPTIARLDFYQKVIQIQEGLKVSDQTVENSIQTNATLLDADWASFLKKNGFSVGVSIDGPYHLHNITRINAYGRGSFDEVDRGIRYLKEARIRVGAIAVVNSHNISFPEDIFWFMHSHGLSFGANPCFASSDASREMLALSITPMQYALFLERLLDLWLELDDPNFRIRPLEDIVKGVLGKRPTLCRYTGNCARYITIDSGGDVYPCNEYLNPKRILGNIMYHTVKEIIQGEASVLYFQGRASMYDACRSCEWYLICRGGCMREWNGRTAVYDPVTEEFCQARQWLFGQAKFRLAKVGYEVQNAATD